MKKLLILGGSRYLIPVIKKAHDLGIFVITCDYLPDNYAHKLSDKYINVSITEKEKVLEVAINENIDGIISFACDPGVVTAAYVAEHLQLPRPGPLESVRILQNKFLFRTFLKANNFNVPYFKLIKSLSDVSENESLPYPLIVKPVDSAGSKGVKKVNNFQELAAAIDGALRYSLSKEVIVEKFLEKTGNTSDADSFVVNSKFVFFGINSQLFDAEASNPYVPSAYYWPTSFTDSDIAYFRDELERLFSLLGIKTSIFNIELRKDSDGTLYIMEVSPRGGGNRLSEMNEIMTGNDYITEFIKYSVGLPYSDCSLCDNTSSSNYCELIVHAKKKGIFKCMHITDEIDKYIIENDIWIKEGDEVSAFTGANETIGTVILRLANATLVEKLINDTDRYFEVLID